MSVLFITGIDTGIGKSVVTGLLGRYLLQHGVRVTTSKLVQTGCRRVSEDLGVHRRLMNQAWTDADAQGLTCPYCFRFPGSPALAARLEHRRIRIAALDRATRLLHRQADLVLMEGAGGVFVPLTPRVTTLDFLTLRRYPCVVVTSSRLGSINHTLLTLEALQTRRVPVLGLVYKRLQREVPEIAADTRRFLRRRFPQIPIVDCPWVTLSGPLPQIDFSPLLGPGIKQIGHKVSMNWIDTSREK